MISSTIAAVIRADVGKDPMPGAPRHVNQHPAWRHPAFEPSTEELEKEVSLARMYCGVHYRNSADVRLQDGRAGRDGPKKGVWNALGNGGGEWPDGRNSTGGGGGGGGPPPNSVATGWNSRFATIAAGRLREAVETLSRDLLRAAPNGADVTCKGSAELSPKAGRPEEGAHLMATSLELKPDRPQVMFGSRPAR